jgi:hypothetical protein
LHGVEAARVEAFVPLPNDALLLVKRRVADDDFQQEAVELGFGQRVRAFVFNRVFSCEHGEKRRERMQFAVNRHLSFFHRFEQCGLRFRRRAVDFVGEQDVCEDRAGTQRKRRVRDVEDVCAGDVRRHQVGRELYAIEFRADDAGDGFDHQGLRRSRHAFDQRVTFGEQRDDDLLDHHLLPDDDAREFALDVVNGRGDGGRCVCGIQVGAR